jgi:hypothetical protein
VLLAAVSAATVGAVVASRRHRHPVGWLLLATGLTMVVDLGVNGYVRYGVVVRPGSLPSPRWRWWARVAAAGLVLELLSAAIDPQPLYPEHPEVGNPLAVSALRPVQIAVGFGGGAVILASLVLAALGAMVALLPLATGAAILRYRLYDLDRIVSRTVAYGLLTVLLGLGYAAMVLGLGRLLGSDSSLVVAAATLAVAAVFQPARRRIQRAVDRRFNRRRYDAARTVQAFSTRLRDQVDLTTLTGELLAVVDQTMQPTRSSLWLRTQGAPGAAGEPAPGQLSAMD